jgi:hypothetical protein
MPIDTSMLPFGKPKRKEKSESRFRTGRQTMMEKSIALAEKITRHKAVCLRCGTDKHIDAHHIVKRSYKKTVGNLFNLIPLCRYECHRFAEDYPEAFQEWIDMKLPGRRIMMESINRTNGKNDWQEVYDGLLKSQKEKA